MPRVKSGRPLKDYSPGVGIRVVLLIALWIFYGLEPHLIPTWSLLIVTGLLGWYAYVLYTEENVLMTGLIGLAALCNTILALGADSFLFVLIIFLVLIFDVINLPWRN